MMELTHELQIQKVARCGRERNANQENEHKFQESDNRSADENYSPDVKDHSIAVVIITDDEEESNAAVKTIKDEEAQCTEEFLTDDEADAKNNTIPAEGLKCSSVVKKAKVFRKHLIHKCSECDSTFKSARQLKYHVQSHTDIKSYKCSSCDREFTTPAGLSRHTKTRHDKPHKTVHACPICKKQSPAAVELIDHMREHLPGYQHKCILCNTIFATFADLHSHNIHNHACSVCEKKFDNHIDLVAHLTKNKNNKMTASCKICNQDFPLHCHLTEHLYPDGTKTPYTCDQCKDCFAYPCGLEMHRSLHSDKRDQPETHLNATNAVALEMEEGKQLPLVVSDDGTQMNALTTRASDANTKAVVTFQTFADEASVEETKRTKTKENNFELEGEIKKETCDDFEEFEFVGKQIRHSNEES